MAGAELHETLLKSKADARNADSVVIMRLTAHSPKTKHHLIGDEERKDLPALLLP